MERSERIMYVGDTVRSMLQPSFLYVYVCTTVGRRGGRVDTLNMSCLVLKPLLPDFRGYGTICHLIRHISAACLFPTHPKVYREWRFGALCHLVVSAAALPLFTRDSQCVPIHILCEFTSKLSAL